MLIKNSNSLVKLSILYPQTNSSMLSGTQLYNLIYSGSFFNEGFDFQEKLNSDHNLKKNFRFFFLNKKIKFF